MKLRTLLLCIAAAFALTLCAGAADVVDRGFCGENVMWTLDSDGLLTISGAGAMDDYDGGNAPWREKRDAITGATINGGVTSVGAWAFWGCKSLTSVKIPDSVTSIGEWAFVDCVSLTSVAIPDRVTSIGEAAFSGCESLTSVEIPDSVALIGDSAFSDCYSLTAVIVGSHNQRYMTENGVLFDKNRETLLWCPIGKAGAYEIPDSVTRIGLDAFSNCASLTSLAIPHSVSAIDNGVFYGCASLTSLAIPDSVSAIGEWAFAKCAGLTGVTIPDSVASIGYGAFYACESLKSVAIPARVTTLYGNMFYGCASLTSVAVPDSLTAVFSGAFDACPSLTDVSYGGSATQWSEIRIYGYNDALRNATVRCHAKDIGIGITLTDQNGETVDGNGRTGETTDQNAFRDGAEFTAKFQALDLDAAKKLVVANVFAIFFDKDGLMVSLRQWEMDLSDADNLSFMADITIPEGAKRLKILILGDHFEPLRAARMIGSSAA